MKILIATPCNDEIDVGYVQCLLSLKRVGECAFLLLTGSLIYASREAIAEKAVNEGFDYVLWIDSDMTFPPTLLLDLIAHDKDIVTGVCAMRRHPYTPCVYIEKEKYEAITDWPDRLFEVDACGFGAILTKVEVLEKMFEKYQTCFQPLPGFGEDMSFCRRAKELGFKIYADPNIDIGHIGKTIVKKDSFRRM